MFDAFTKVDCDAKVLSFNFLVDPLLPKPASVNGFCHSQIMSHGCNALWSSESSFSGDMGVIQHTVARNPGYIQGNCLHVSLQNVHLNTFKWQST